MSKMRKLTIEERLDAYKVFISNFDKVLNRGYLILNWCRDKGLIKYSDYTEIIANWDNWCKYYFPELSEALKRFWNNNHTDEALSYLKSYVINIEKIIADKNKANPFDKSKRLSIYKFARYIYSNRSIQDKQIGFCGEISSITNRHFGIRLDNGLDWFPELLEYKPNIPYADSIYWFKDNMERLRVLDKIISRMEYEIGVYDKFMRISSNIDKDIIKARRIGVQQHFPIIDIINGDAEIDTPIPPPVHKSTPIPSIEKRLEVYKKLKDWYERNTTAVFGICSVLKNYNIYKTDNVARDFPELGVYKEHRKDTTYWFRDNKERLNALRTIIADINCKLCINIGKYCAFCDNWQNEFIPKTCNNCANKDKPITDCVDYSRWEVKK